MPRKRNQHVVPAKDGWAVKRAGSQKATKVFGTRHTSTHEPATRGKSACFSYKSLRNTR